MQFSHSPVTADGPMRQVIENHVGQPKHVVDQYEHLKFAPEWAAAYPDANFGVVLTVSTYAH
jgi:hypothetical protein